MTAGCPNMAAPGRRHCEKCRKRSYRSRHPIRACFQNLRWNATWRMKEFDLPFDEFRSLCLATGYHDQRGRAADSLSIDRIDPTKGYVTGNVQVITLRENSIKGSTSDIRIYELSECPF